MKRKKLFSIVSFVLIISIFATGCISKNIGKINKEDKSNKTIIPADINFLDKKNAPSISIM